MNRALAMGLWFAIIGAGFMGAIGLPHPVDAAEVITQTVQSGPVSIDVSLAPPAPVIGDTLTLSIQVTTEADVEVLMPDFGDALDRFSIVDFAPRESIDDQGRRVAKQTYRLDPPSSGKHVIPPILIEYIDRRPGQKEAPEGADAYEVLTDRMPFTVASVLPSAASSELQPPLGRLEPIEAPQASRWAIYVGVLLVFIALPFLLHAITVVRRRQRRRSAYEVAATRLEQLLSLSRQGGKEIEQFYVGLSAIIRQYIEDRFVMRAPELTTEEFLVSIGQSPDFSVDHQGLLKAFLKQADLVKFARAEPSESEIKHAIADARRFLEETREDAPRIVPDSDEATHG